jgi:mannose-1-phosphate guanylyltransferase
MDLTAEREQHERTGARATLCLIAVEDTASYGVVPTTPEGEVEQFLEKASGPAPTNRINAGAYLLERDVIERIPPGRAVSIEREIFPELQARGGLRAHISSSYWRDIGTPRSYLAASHDVLSGAVGAREGFDYLDVDPSVRVGKNVKLLPPVSVASGCEIENLATIGGRSSLGRGCRVGEGAVVEGSILLEGAEIEAGAIVRGSIIGMGARVGQDAIVRGLSVLGAGCVVGEGNVLDQGIRINPAVVLPPRSLRF